MGKKKTGPAYITRTHIYVYVCDYMSEREREKKTAVWGLNNMQENFLTHLEWIGDEILGIFGELS